MKARLPRLRLLYVVLSLAFLSKVLFVNLTYTKLQWKQEEAQQSQQEPLNAIVMNTTSSSNLNATSTTTRDANKVAIPIPRKVRIEQQQRLERRRERMNTTAKEKLLKILKNNPRLARLNNRRKQLRTTAANDASASVGGLRRPHTRYAYAFLIGGVHEDRPPYKGFLYNVLIASYLLHTTGSTMDIIIYIQLSPDSQLVNQLPNDDIRLIEAFNDYIKKESQSNNNNSKNRQSQTHDRLRIKFLDRPTGNKESFSELVYDKFRILQEIEYTRVMFLDGDVIPLTNMDYFFTLSEGSKGGNTGGDGGVRDTPVLQPNFIMASRGEPCNAGMFILEPKIGEWEHLQQVIHAQHVAAKDLPYPKFDREYGWGHSFIKSNDYWEGIVKNGTMWKYHASHSDQGLLYYWVKYVKQCVSIAVGNRLVEWIPSPESSSTSLGSLSSPIKPSSLPIRSKDIYRGLQPHMVSKAPLAWQDRCDKRGGNDHTSYWCTPPYREFAHFMGANKPWMTGTGVNYFKGKTTQDNYAAYRLWFQTLVTLNTTLNMNLVSLDEMKNGIPSLQKTPLGHMAMWKDLHERINIKHNNPNNTEVETTTNKNDAQNVKAGTSSTTRRTTEEFSDVNNDNIAEDLRSSSNKEERVIGENIQPANSDKSTSRHSPYAYAFLIGGVHEHRAAYRGFLYDVLISAHILRKAGSIMDIWLFVQISPDSNLTELPYEDSRLLTAFNITTKYVDKPKVKETFNELVYDKFRILQMTDYRRVMFLDADAIPLANLDYMFRLSEGDNPLLQPNFIVASRGEPCNAGLFILEPKEGEWENLQAVITKQHEGAKDLPYPKFNREYGWGHSFKKAGDQWEGIQQNGNMWKYHASHSDQGLLYYWVKYVKQKVSIAIGDKLVKYVPGENGQPFRKEELIRALHPHMTKEPLAWQFSCDRKDSYYCTSPYREYAHFMGGNKPWQKGNGRAAATGTSTAERVAPYRLWFKELGEINDMLDMGLDLSKMGRGIQNMTETPLGHMAMWYDHHVRVEQLTQQR